MPVVPRCLVVRWKEGDFTKGSPFLIERVVTSYAGSAVEDNREAVGGLLIETLNDQQHSWLLKIQKIVDIEVEVVPHST